MRSRTRSRSAPSPHKDLNDWGRNGLTPDALAKAIEEAPVLEPLAESTEEWNERKIREGREQAQRESEADEASLFEELLSKYEAAVKTVAELEELDIPERKFLIEKWMREGDTGFVFGERGSGKTWFIDALATSASMGRALFDWTVPEPIDVLLIDGEMPPDAVRDRLKGLSPGNKRLHLLHHQVLFDQTGLAMNLTDERVQQVVTALCEKRRVKLLILDNLSCLFAGLPENEADPWERVLIWLLDLRRRRIAVLIVHHASRSGTMRGTSKREDSAFWIIRVDEVKDRDCDEPGAHFETTFTKQRNSERREWTRDWTFRTEADGQITIGCEEISFAAKVLQLIQAGLTSATEIAEELGAAKSTVCKSVKGLINQKLVELRGRQYRPRGFMKQ